MAKFQDISYYIYYCFLPVTGPILCVVKNNLTLLVFYVLLLHFKQKLKITFCEHFSPIYYLFFPFFWIFPFFGLVIFIWASVLFCLLSVLFFFPLFFFGNMVFLSLIICMSVWLHFSYYPMIFHILWLELASHLCVAF